MQTLLFPWHWFQINWASHFSPHYSNGINGTTFIYLEKLFQNFHQILEIVTHKTIKRTNIPSLSWILFLQNHNILILNKNLIKFAAVKYHIFTIGKTFTADQHDHPINGLMGLLRPVTSCRYHKMVEWRHNSNSE